MPLSSHFIEPGELKSLLTRGAPLLDMRAPVEFLQGAAPYAQNTPLLNNEEREQVGITYKEEGQQAAIALGHRLVCGETKETRISRWIEISKVHACQALYCARGGLRSEISQQWLEDAGLFLPRVRGGYKVLRQLFLQTLEELPGKDRFLIVTGKTGSGKTHFLHNVAKNYPILDLEGLAKHRGSAFGDVYGKQPSQATFENALAQKLLALESSPTQPILIEDESRMIGKVRIPDPFFTTSRQRPVVEIEIPFTERVDSIIEDYVTALPQLTELGDTQESDTYLTDYLKRSVLKISRKLGGERTQQVLSEIEKAMTDYGLHKDPTVHRNWVSFLLKDYYDRHYIRHIESSRERIIFSGTPSEVFDFLSTERLF